MATNTLIITSKEKNVAESTVLEELRDFLESHVLSRFTVTHADAMQLVALPAMQRLVLVCPTSEIAQSALTAKSQCTSLDDLKFQFSLVDTTTASQKQYLELPSHQSFFLVSPPTSPPPEFDYSRLEEHPNREKGLVPVSHLNEKMSPQSPHPAGHHVLLETPNASITLDSCATDSEMGFGGLGHVSAATIRTGMPPRSIFDDIED